MKKILLILILLPITILSQTQVGSDIDGEEASDQSGFSVSISSDGNTVAIGAPFNAGNGINRGHVRVFNTNTGSQIGQDIDGEADGDQSGFSVSLSSDGTIVAIGAPYNAGTGSNAGHVRVYKNISNTWTQLGADINAEAFGDYSGWSVSLSSDGTNVAIGAYANSSSKGQVRVYNYNGSVWTKKGADIDGEAVGDQSGISVSLSSDGNTVAIGANFNDGNGSNSGHVRVYNFDTVNWIQKGADIDGEVGFDQSGYSVSLSSTGNVVAIGAIRNGGNGSNSGHVRVYDYNGSVWNKIGADLDGETSGDFSGWSVSLSSTGNIVAIGARGNTNSRGHVRVYKNTSGTWNQVGVDIDGEADSDYSGSSVSLSSDGSIVAIGAPGNDGSFDSAGQVRIYNLSSVLSSNSVVFSSFEMYPNPVLNQFSIKLNEGIQLKKVNIYNQLGQFIKEDSKLIIDVSRFSKGLYLVEIITNKGKATKKLIIN